MVATVKNAKPFTIDHGTRSKGDTMNTPVNNSVLKGFRILSLFSNDQREISTRTVVDRLGMSHATAHRFLISLERAGALRMTGRGRFALGSKIEELGSIAGEFGSLSIIVQPEIDRLSTDLNESVMACRLTRYGPACVAVANSPRPISVNISVGTLLPLHSTAQGQLWLAEMSQGETPFEPLFDRDRRRTNNIDRSRVPGRNSQFHTTTGVCLESRWQRA